LRNKNQKITVVGIILFLFFSSILYFSLASAQTADILPPYGDVPVIDGIIDSANGEWESAYMTQLQLFPDSINPVGLTIELWVIQNDTIEEKSDIYFSVQFSLQDHNSSEFDNEFLGFAITEEDHPQEKIEDVKLIQYRNMSINEFEYLDYYINNSVYVEDILVNGEGASRIAGNQNRIVYEFRFPVQDEEDLIQDIRLDKADTYFFNIFFGNPSSSPAVYPDDIILENSISIEIQFNRPGPDAVPWEEIALVLSIVFFCIIGVLYAWYLYRISLLKRKMERIKVKNV